MTELFSKDVIEKGTEYLRQTPKLSPVEIDGEKYYLAYMHPIQHYKLKVMLAREKYKHERWLERYNRWLASRGEPPDVETEPEVGTFEGVTIRCHRS